MRELSLENDFEMFNKLFYLAKDSQSLIIAWQLDESGKRNIFPSLIYDYNKKKQVFSVSHFEEREYFFGPSPIFFYFHGLGLLFKTENISVQSNIAEFKYPNAMKILESEKAIDEMINMAQSFTDLGSKARDELKISNSQIQKEAFKITGVTEKISTIWKSKTMSERDQDILTSKLKQISLEDEEELVHELRKSPRSRPKIEKSITIKHNSLETEIKNFSLNDLSQGGMSFLVSEEKEFAQGDSVFVFAFDEQTFDSALQARVVAVVAIGDGLFKVGCEFLV